jgi:DNA mismatch repair protein MutL
MSRIRILSDHLANQIAAGEVVERPASIVKELLENSLDAGCTRVNIQVEGGGTRLLRVMDNGMGMDEDDVLLCLERHATSKLQEEGQLGAISTLGFRGEAIPSIASVSRFTILSRIAENPTGTRAEIRYGTLHAVHEDGCSKGTIVEVKNLFGNIPARRKFLKSARTELFHIEEVIKNQALAHPEVVFSLQVEGRQSLNYPKSSDLEERMRAVFRFQGQLLELQASGGREESAILCGFLQLPESVSTSTARLRLLVNGRPVQDRMIRHAVIEGLQGFLMKGQSPAGVLLLELPPSEIDVNVHPAKREIRFRRSKDVHQFVSGAVRRAVQLYQEQIRSDLFTTPPVDEQLSEPEVFSAAPSFASRSRPTQQSLASLSEHHDLPLQAGLPESREPELLPETASPPIPSLVNNTTAQQENVIGLTVIGQLFNLYLLCEKEGQLVVIDQHAAHERILYGRMRQAYLEQKVPAQNLLFPVTVELGPDHCELFERHGNALSYFGLQAAHFGEATYVIKAVPALISQLAPADILVETLDALQNTSSVEEGALPAAIDALFATMACRAAIKAGNRLQPREMLELLVQMEESEVFSHCPHGRPVVKRFSRGEIEKWFHRT